MLMATGDRTVSAEAGRTPPLVFSNHGLRAAGGIERYLLTLVQGLHARGQRPVVVAKRFDTSIAEYNWVDPVQVHVGWLPGKLRDAWFDLRLRQLKQRHGWFPLIGLNQTGASDIAICGSNHPAHLAAMGRTPDWSDRLKLRVERDHVQRARMVVAHSQLIAQQTVAHHGIDAAKVQVAYPPVDTTRFTAGDATARAQARTALGLPPDVPVFLLASTGHARKGLDLAVQALGQDPTRALLVVAGRPPGTTAPALRYLGYRADMEAVYRAVDCTLVASRYEPFGLVAIESVLCGTPVICAEQVGAAEVITDSAMQRFSVAEPASLHAAVQRFIQTWQPGQRLDDPHACLRYDPSVDAHLDFLLDCVARLRAGPP